MSSLPFSTKRPAFARPLTLQACLWVLMAVVLPGKAQTFQNPIRYSAPDPWMVYHNGNYYMTYTVGNRIDVISAASIQGLSGASAQTVWTDNTWERSDNMWAPEFHYLNGKWYLYYSATGPGFAGGLNTHVLEGSGSTPLGPYTYKAFLKSGYDPHVFQANGRLYYVHSRTASDNYGKLYIQEMSNPWTLIGSETQLNASNFGCGDGTREGGEVLVRNNRVFLIYSACYYGNADYKLGMISAGVTANLLSNSSWFQTSNPVFQTANGAYGPGHNGFFTSPNGTEDWIVYHAWPSSGGQSAGGERSARVQKFTWNSDGTPNFGAPVSTSTSLALPAGDPGTGSGGNGIVSGGIYELEPQCAPGMRLDVTGAVDADGTNALLYHQNGASAQDWKLVDVGGGYYELIPQCAPSRRLDVAGSGSSDGTQVYIWYRWGDNNPAQRWKLINRGDGYYELEPQCAPGMRLDVAGSGNTDNTEVYLWHRWSDNNAAQKWKLIFQSNGARTAPPALASRPGAELPQLSLYPNPSSGKVFVSYVPARREAVRLHLYDSQGRLVTKLFEGEAPAGTIQQYNVHTAGFSPGIYLLRLSTPAGSQQRKLILTK